MDVSNDDFSEDSNTLLNNTEPLNKSIPKFSIFDARHVLAFMSFLGFFSVYVLRVNLSVALVAMVNSTQKLKKDNSSTSGECPNPDGTNHTSSNVGEFDWNEETQGYILGAFFYGYILTQLPGGWLASKIGGKNLFGFGVFVTAILTLVTPIAARTSVYLFIAVRVMEGLFEGVTYPAMYAMWGVWAPIWERSRLVSFSTAGSQLGTVVSLPLSGILCDSDIAGGWPSVFYIFGSLACLWFVLWMLIVHDTPASHPRISKEEREYIETSIGHKTKILTPWKGILTSRALWGLAAVHISNNWSGYTLLTCLPLYMKHILNYDMTENGAWSALPYLVCWLVSITGGIVVDYIRRKRYISTKNVRKLCNCIGILVPGFFLIIVGYVGCDHILAVSFLTLSVGFAGIACSGFGINHLDIAPRFAGILLGITNSLGTIPGFLSPIIVGYLTNHNQTRGQWQKVFYISGAIGLIGTIINVILAEGEEQPWAKPNVMNEPKESPARLVVNEDFPSPPKNDKEEQ